MISQNLGLDETTELLGVLSGSKLFAYVTMVAIGRITVKYNRQFFSADEKEM